MNKKNIRVIPRMDIKGPNLVKGIHLEGLRVLGSPEEFSKYYYENGADELLYMDVVASLYGRNSLFDIIQRTAKHAYIPLTVGGGIRGIEDIRTALRAGADKVCLNTAAVRNPELIQSASKRFGSSTIVIAIEAIKQPDGRYLAFTDNGREETGLDAFEWAQQAEALGAGEIVATSVDREGTGSGYDCEFVRRMADSLSIPVIAHGGPGNARHVQEVVTMGRADAVAVASILHYHYIQLRNDTFSSSSEGNTEFLKRGSQSRRLAPSSISAIKECVRSETLDCRV